MKLHLNKSQRVKGLTQKVSYSLTAKVELTEEERKHIHKYRLTNILVYTKDRITPDMGRNPSLLRNLSAAALNLRISISELLHGRTIVCKDIHEIMDAEVTIMQSCQVLKNILDNCAGFEGEQIIEF